MIARGIGAVETLHILSGKGQFSDEVPQQSFFFFSGNEMSSELLM